VQLDFFLASSQNECLSKPSGDESLEIKTNKDVSVINLPTNQGYERARKANPAHQLQSVSFAHEEQSACEAHCCSQLPTLKYLHFVSPQGSCDVVLAARHCFVSEHQPHSAIFVHVKQSFFSEQSAIEYNGKLLGEHRCITQYRKDSDKEKTNLEGTETYFLSSHCMSGLLVSKYQHKHW
jgi:hypothetical protein